MIKQDVEHFRLTRVELAQLDALPGPSRREKLATVITRIAVGETIFQPITAAVKNGLREFKIELLGELKTLSNPVPVVPPPAPKDSAETAAIRHCLTSVLTKFKSSKLSSSEAEKLVVAVTIMTAPETQDLSAIRAGLATILELYLPQLASDFGAHSLFSNQAEKLKNFTKD